MLDPDGPAAPLGPTQPSHAPPALPKSPQTYHVNPPQNNALAMFNQTLNQKGLVADWPAESTGPPHALRWSVKCMGG